MGKNCGGGPKRFFGHWGRGILAFCVLGFSAGLLMALFLPPVIIAVTECVLLVFLCICLYNDSLFR